MRFLTHFLFALFIALYFKFSLVISILLVFFAILPDIDKYNSKIGKKFLFISIPLNMLGHRGFMHSMWVVILLYMLLLPLGLGAAALGYFSHLILDMLTPQGIKLFWPLFSVKGYFKTGGVVDWLLTVFFFAGSGILLFVSIQ